MVLQGFSGSFPGSQGASRGFQVLFSGSQGIPGGFRDPLGVSRGFQDDSRNPRCASWLSGRFNYLETPLMRT